MLRKKGISILCVIPLILSSGVMPSRLPQFTAEQSVEMISFERISDLKTDTYEQLLNEKIVEIQNAREIELIKEEELAREIEIEEEKIRIAKEYESKIQHWKFEVSYYCACWSCTQNGNGQTASGEYAVEGTTIALPSDIPFGTEVYIEGVGSFINQDVGGFIQYTYDNEGNTVMRVDVYLNSHEDCYSRGRHYSNGYIKYK